MQKMNDAQRALVEKNLYIVGLRIKRRMQYILPGEREDYFQIGAIGLCKAAMTYEQGRGAFNTYASRCIDNEIFMQLRIEMARRHDRQAVRLDAGKGKSEQMTLAESLPALENAETAYGAIDLLDQIEKRFTGTEKRILRLHMDGRGQEDIGRAVNLSQSYVSRVIRRMKRTILEISA